MLDFVDRAGLLVEDGLVVVVEAVHDGVDVCFLTILSREPTEEELLVAMKEVKEIGPAGYGNVVWSLINTREFLFIQ